jgi:hypothetical protein
VAFASINDPKHWRDRAVEMRALAEGMNDMIRLAEDYENLADRANAHSNGGVGPAQG